MKDLMYGGILFLCVSLGFSACQLSSDLSLTLAATRSLEQNIQTDIRMARLGLQDTQKELLLLASIQANKANNSLAKTLGNLDLRLASIESTVAAKTDRALSQVDRVTDLAENTLNQVKPIIETANLAAQNSKPYLDCKKNHGCVQETTVETLNAVRAAARDGSRLAFTMNGQIPEIVNNTIKITDAIEKSSQAVAKDFPLITSNVNDITQSLKERVKIHWYDRVIGWAMNGLVAYGVAK